MESLPTTRKENSLCAPHAPPPVFLQVPAPEICRQRKLPSTSSHQRRLAKRGQAVSSHGFGVQFCLKADSICSALSCWDSVLCRPLIPLLNSASDNVLHNYRLGLISLIGKKRIFKGLCNICTVTHPGNGNYDLNILRYISKAVPVTSSFVHSKI